MPDITLEIASDYVCPWCYLASARTERLRNEYNVYPKYVAFQLRPNTPEDGIDVAAHIGVPASALSTMHARMAGLFAQENLPFNPATKLYDTRRAHELAKWAERVGARNIHVELFRAAFVDQANLGKIDVLCDIARRVGLSPDDARTTLERRAFAREVDEDLARVASLRITGAPTYIAGKFFAVGLQAYENLERLAVRAGARRR